MLTTSQLSSLQSAMEQIQQGATLALAVLSELSVTPVAVPSFPKNDADFNALFATLPKSPAVSELPSFQSTSIRAFVHAISLVQSRGYLNTDSPLLRMAKDHVFLERLAAELGLIASAHAHTEYIRELRKAAQQEGLHLSHFPKNKVNLSYYISSVRGDASFPEWQSGNIAHFDFLRCMELTKQVLSEFHRLSVEMSD